MFDSPNRSRLRLLLVLHFSESELRDLCFDLGIDFEIIPGPTKSDKARELLAYTSRHGHHNALIAQCRRLRPHVEWEEPPGLFDHDAQFGAAPPASSDLPSSTARATDAPNETPSESLSSPAETARAPNALSGLALTGSSLSLGMLLDHLAHRPMPSATSPAQLDGADHHSPPLMSTADDEVVNSTDDDDTLGDD